MTCHYTQVTQIEREGPHFQVHTATGQSYLTRTVIAATGSFNDPYLPQLPGQVNFRGQVLHAAAYRNPHPFHNQRIVVVGGGNSAVQIAIELAQVAQVTLVSRQPVKFVPQKIGGKDIHFWKWLTGLDTLPLGQWFDFYEPVGVLDVGDYRLALKNRRPEWRSMFSHFTESSVIWANGQEQAVDTVIFATGYRPHLPFLRSLEEFKGDQPHQRGGVSKTVPGLYYVGLEWQRSHASATVRGVGADAAFVVKRLQRLLTAQEAKPHIFMDHSMSPLGENEKAKL